MAKPLVSDALWQRIEPLLPPPKPRRFRSPGRKPLDRRKVLTGIIFVLKTGLPWEYFPQELGCCGMTLWNRLHEWHAAGVWPRLHAALLAGMRGADLIDFDRAVADSPQVRAVHGGEKKSGPARWTAASRGASTTCWSTPTARRWSRGSRPPTATTARS